MDSPVAPEEEKIALIVESHDLATAELGHWWE